ncbi:hypothetical protein GC173_18810 [bacterium]|nr:hypothetical protein [bacterium]
MLEVEVIAKDLATAMARAAEKTEVAAENLELIEEYEPDEVDLADYVKENNLTEAPSAQEVTLYVIRVSFNHYLKEAQEWTQGLIERFAPGSTAEAVRFRNIIILRLNVPEASILIGKMGATLDALQHVVVRALLTVDDKFPDVMLDVEGYREKKLQRLEKEAIRSADKANRIGRRIPLAPMSPAERKFVHNLLKENGKVKTESRGEGDKRHIVIEPLNPRPQAPRREGGFGGGNRGGNPGGGNRGGGFGGNRGGSGGGFGGNRGGNSGGGNRSGGPNRQGPPRDGNRDGNRADFRGGPNRQGPPRDDRGPRITDEQRRKLYGNYDNNPNQAPPPKPSTPDDGQVRFLDELDDKLR